MFDSSMYFRNFKYAIVWNKTIVQSLIMKVDVSPDRYMP